MSSDTVTGFLCGPYSAHHTIHIYLADPWTLMPLFQSGLFCGPFPCRGYCLSYHLFHSYAPQIQLPHPSSSSLLTPADLRRLGWVVHPSVPEPSVLMHLTASVMGSWHTIAKVCSPWGPSPLYLYTRSDWQKSLLLVSLGGFGTDLAIQLHPGWST